MVTIDLDNFDRETEVQITAAKSGLPTEDAARIVDIVRGLRESDACEFAPTIRGCNMIAKTAVVRRAMIRKDDEIFRQICFDILSSETSRIGNRSNQERVKEVIAGLIDLYC
jgi:hypothetical protein